MTTYSLPSKPLKKHFLGVLNAIFMTKVRLLSHDLNENVYPISVKSLHTAVRIWRGGSKYPVARATLHGS